MAVAVVALAVPAVAAAQTPTYAYGPSNYLGEPGVQDEAYCAAAGNTWPATGSIADGTPIPQGTFLDLVAGQPSWDSHYTGATPAVWVVGVGLSCNNPPAGYVQQGTTDSSMPVPVGLYTVYGPPAGYVAPASTSTATAAQAPTYSYGAANWVGEPGVQDEAYCAATGNTWPATGSIADGTPIPQGTFLDLVAGQPSWDSHYTGATPAVWVVGVGLSCNNPPAGDVQVGTTDSAMSLPEGLYTVYGPRPTTG